jgi:hypothetical protein
MALRAYYEQTFASTKVTDAFSVDIARGIEAYKRLPCDNPLVSRHPWSDTQVADWFSVAHFKVMNDSGFRTRHAFMKGSSEVYAPPDSIERRLECLVEFVRGLPRTGEITQLVRTAAFFLAEFVKIHPFPKHNLQTGREIVTNMLRVSLPLPFSVLPASADMTRLLGRPDGSAIAAFIMKDVHRSAAQAEWLSLV